MAFRKNITILYSLQQKIKCQMNYFSSPMSSSTVAQFFWLKVLSKSYAPQQLSCSPVVLNPAGGTEPHKFHTCIHRTLRSCKNKVCVVNFIYFIFIAQNLLTAEPLGFDLTQFKNGWFNVTRFRRDFLTEVKFLPQ